MLRLASIAALVLLAPAAQAQLLAPSTKVSVFETGLPLIGDFPPGVLVKSATGATEAEVDYAGGDNLLRTARGSATIGTLRAAAKLDGTGFNPADQPDEPRSLIVRTAFTDILRVDGDAEFADLQFAPFVKLSGGVDTAGQVPAFPIEIVITQELRRDGEAEFQAQDVVRLAFGAGGVDQEFALGNVVVPTNVDFNYRMTFSLFTPWATEVVNADFFDTLVVSDLSVTNRQGQAVAFDLTTASGFDFGISAVPEAATWALMIVGFGLVGSAARRRLGRNVGSAPLDYAPLRSGRATKLPLVPSEIEGR